MTFDPQTIADHIGLTADDIDLVAVEIAKARNIAGAVSLDDLLDEAPPADDGEGFVE